MALFVEEVLVIVGVTVLCGDVEDMVWLRTEGVLLGLSPAPNSLSAL